MPAGMGFCLFNNVAIAATADAQSTNGCARLSWIWSHHGNGTQDIFYLYPSGNSFSVPPIAALSRTGRADETGEGPG